MKIVNPKYHIETFRCKRTGTLYFSDANSWDYYNRFDSVCGIYIIDILNNYSHLIPHEVSENDKILSEIPNDLFLTFVENSGGVVENLEEMLEEIFDDSEGYNVTLYDIDYLDDYDDGEVVSECEKCINKSTFNRIVRELIEKLN